MGKKFLRDINVSLLLLIIIPTFCSCTNEMNMLERNNNEQINFAVSVPSWKSDDSTAGNPAKTETRAPPIADTFLGTDKTFGIIADVVNGSNYTTEIDQEVVSYNATNKIWETVANHYWPGANKTVNFYAYYPASITNGTITHTAGTTPTLTYTVPADATTQVDIMTATGTNVSGNTNSSTPLTFSHIFAAVKFAVGTNGLPSGIIKSITISGIKSSGTYTFGSGWALGSTISSFTVSPSTTITGAAGANITSDTFTMMMIPQIFTNATITLTYNTGTSYKQTISGNWTAGTTYTYNLSKPVNIGDYYYSDGTWGTIAEHSSSTALPIGIIFYNSTSLLDSGHGWKHGYAMALQTAAKSIPWESSNDGIVDNKDVNTNFPTTFDKMKLDMDGYTHCLSMKTYGGSNSKILSNSNYPAYYSALNFGNGTYGSVINAAPKTNNSGWYLPSIGQWYYFMLNIGKASFINNGTSGSSAQASSTIENSINTYINLAKTYNNTSETVYSISWNWCSSEYSASIACDAAFSGDAVYIIGNLSKEYIDNMVVRPAIAF
ncbi:fimbrillin family protein [Segatella paludivivens]|uniref:fimbrillin family protein n=1 Tax=Segatella paludivivens TaxID=185294 RepID=UPI0003A8D983|nr:fimbrillin family protein [Segatella paludivivens]